MGTRDGVFLASDIPFGDADTVLDCGRVLRVRTFDSQRGAYAASQSGLYHSSDGTTWRNLGVPQTEVYSVLVSPDRQRLYAGTHPAHLYVSTNGGDAWRELLGFQDLPSRTQWHTPRHRNEAHVRSLGAHVNAADRIVAGVEVGGVHVSDDRGETWEERRDGVHDDVHHVLVVDADSYVASCGGGLYRTDDAGHSWTRLDSELDHGYFREAFQHDDVLYAAAARGPPPSWGGDRGTDAALFESRDGGETFTEYSYPGAPEEFVLAWTAVDGNVVAGTNKGRVLRRHGEDDWETIGTVSAGVTSLCAV